MRSESLNFFKTNGVSLIREMPIEERPRERLERVGVQSLTDAEILAILLRSGSKGTSAVHLAQKLLQRFGGLNQLARQTVDEIARVSGMGRVKAITCKAAFDLHSRIMRQSRQEKPLDTPEKIFEYFHDQCMTQNSEVLIGISLDVKLRLIRYTEISRGTVNQTLIHPREVFRDAISCGAVQLLLVHNHPSGDPTPSVADLRATREMVEAGKVLGINLLDHVIIGRISDAHPSGFFSMKQGGVL